MNQVDARRVRKLNHAEAENKGPVVYWMSRDQRANNNWALIFAQEIAEKSKQTLYVVFNLQDKFLNANLNHFGFMIEGLKQVEEDLYKKRINFIILKGEAEVSIPKFLHHIKAGSLVTDFSPLKISKNWKEGVAKKITIPFYEVDAHNIIPSFFLSDKQEYAAYTIRPKIKKLLNEFLTPYNKIKFNDYKFEPVSNNWDNLLRTVHISNETTQFYDIKSGTKSAYTVLDEFIDRKIQNYSLNRNDPSLDFSSNLSPYLHFGQISSQEVIMTINEKHRNDDNLQSFQEELVVRKELSDNFCLYNTNYDNPEGFPEWAIKSLDKRKKDPREFLYSLPELENSQTHDPLWNAAQNEMKFFGKMHGYMRMYWAKKILEWSADYESAQKNAIFLNDKYELDGRDPNGYTGVAWSIGGVHDRPWFERNIFGAVRYMNFEGCKRKFDINKYIQKIKTKIEKLS